MTRRDEILKGLSELTASKLRALRDLVYPYRAVEAIDFEMRKLRDELELIEEAEEEASCEYFNRYIAGDR